MAREGLARANQLAIPLVLYPSAPALMVSSAVLRGIRLLYLVIQK